MAGAFPGAPNNLDLHTTDDGTVWQYLADHTRWRKYKDSTSYVEKAGDTMTGALHSSGIISYTGMDVMPYNSYGMAGFTGSEASGFVWLVIDSDANAFIVNSYLII